MIEQFQRCQIERYLRERDLRYLVDQEGDFIVDFYGDEIPDYRVQLSAEGANGEVLGVRLGLETPHPETMRDRIEGFVAGWNRQMRWPKAYVIEDRRGRGIRVIGENSFPLAAGIHQELLDEFIEVSIRAGRQMLGDLVAAAQTPTGDELETWLRRAG